MNKYNRKLIRKLCYKGFFNFLSDELYLKLLFKAKMNRKLNLDNPVTFNEKLQWLKINDRKEIYTTLVDKYAVKEYLKNIIPNEYIIPTLGVWDSFDKIDFESLPDQFVLKCTHNSGNVVICTDKKKLDINNAREKIEASLKKNYFYASREWPYKNIKPQIIAEEYIGTENNPPDDYKFFVFDGKIDNVMICKEREKGHPKFYHYSMDWKRLLYQNNEPKENIKIEKPKNFENMIKIVEALSKGLKSVRIDLYNINGRIYFGEITLFNQSGFDLDITYETDLKWGNSFNVN